MNEGDYIIDEDEDEEDEQEFNEWSETKLIINPELFINPICKVLSISKSSPLISSYILHFLPSLNYLLLTSHFCSKLI